MRGVGTIDLSTVEGRRPLTDIAEAYSGARLERASLPDGHPIVLKHLAPGGDWLTRVTNGEGRLRSMWEGGAFETIGRILDHTTLGVSSLDGNDVAVMRDATDDLLPPAVHVARDTARALLEGLAAVHSGCKGMEIDRPCPIGARYAMFSPDFIQSDTGPGTHPSRDYILGGWELFADHVEPDLAGAIFEVHRNTAWLEDGLGLGLQTLLHGDAKLANLGLGQSGVVAIDWADLTGTGPPEVDVAWFALKGCDRIGCLPEDGFADYEEVSGTRLDPHSLDLACIGSLAQMGFSFANATFGPPEYRSPVAADLFDWWKKQVLEALDRTGPPS
jgi:hypothetical protein